MDGRESLGYDVGLVMCRVDGWMDGLARGGRAVKLQRRERRGAGKGTKMCTARLNRTHASLGVLSV
jgi:hypothetical protein